MNGDLISREALKKELEKVFFNDCDDMNRIEQIIDNAPTVAYSFEKFRTMLCGTCQAYMRTEPKKTQGEWVCREKGMYVSQYACSICGRTVMDDTGYDVSKDYPFCHCGADMKGGAE